MDADPGISLARLRRAADRVDEAQYDLERLVREANRNGIPKTRIAAAVRVSRGTVAAYCDKTDPRDDESPDHP